MKPGPVSATRIHKRTIVIGETVLKKGSLFPFFDRDGDVSHILIVDANSADIRVAGPGSVPRRIWPWGPIVMNEPVTMMDDEVVDELAPLWHYDPWWLLKDERFQSLAAVPVLVRTNCAESFDEAPSDLMFAPGLEQVRELIYETEHPSYDRDMLPLRELERAATERAKTGGWHLDPFWC